MTLSNFIFMLNNDVTALIERSRKEPAQSTYSNNSLITGNWTPDHSFKPVNDDLTAAAEQDYVEFVDKNKQRI